MNVQHILDDDDVSRDEKSYYETHPLPRLHQAAF
jgi:hypothetical protein